MSKFLTLVFVIPLILTSCDDVEDTEEYQQGYEDGYHDGKTRPGGWFLTLSGR